MTDLINAQRIVSVKKYDGYWLDIGRPDDYAQAIDEFESLKETFLK
jgi:NDP-sugar pyrophosphorylase family protein